MDRKKIAKFAASRRRALTNSNPSEGAAPTTHTGEPSAIDNDHALPSTLAGWLDHWERQGARGPTGPDPSAAPANQGVDPRSDLNGARVGPILVVSGKQGWPGGGGATRHPGATKTASYRSATGPEVVTLNISRNDPRFYKMGAWAFSSGDVEWHARTLKMRAFRRGPQVCVECDGPVAEALAEQAECVPVYLGARFNEHGDPIR